MNDSPLNSTADCGSVAEIYLQDRNAMCVLDMPTFFCDVYSAHAQTVCTRPSLSRKAWERGSDIIILVIRGNPDGAGVRAKGHMKDYHTVV